MGEGSPFGLFHGFNTVNTTQLLGEPPFFEGSPCKKPNKVNRVNPHFGMVHPLCPLFHAGFHRLGELVNPLFTFYKKKYIK